MSVSAAPAHERQPRLARRSERAPTGRALRSREPNVDRDVAEEHLPAEPQKHCRRPLGTVHLDEPDAFVKTARGIVLLDAETHR